MICPHCREDVEGTWVDEGIGSYEYWGQKCNDTQMVFQCENCGGELESEYSYEQDRKRAQDEARYEEMMLSR